MIDVSHDRDHRGARTKVFELVLWIHVRLFLEGQLRLDVIVELAFLALKPEAVLGADSDGHRLFEELVDVGENAHAHQVGDELEGLAAELLGQFTHADGRLERDDRGIGRQFGFGGGFLGRAAGAGPALLEWLELLATLALALVAGSALTLVAGASAPSRLGPADSAGPGRQLDGANFFPDARRGRPGGKHNETNFIAHLWWGWRSRGCGRRRRRDGKWRRRWRSHWRWLYGDGRDGDRFGGGKRRGGFGHGGLGDWNLDRQGRRGFLHGGRGRLHDRFRRNDFHWWCHGGGRRNFHHRFGWRWWRRRRRSYFRSRRRGRNGRGRMDFAEFVFEELTGDLVERTRRHLGVSDAQFFRLRENFFVLDPKSFRYFVNTNGHIKRLRSVCPGWSSCHHMQTDTHSAPSTGRLVRPPSRCGG